MDSFEQANNDHADQLAAKAKEAELMKKRLSDQNDRSLNAISEVIIPAFNSFRDRVRQKNLIYATVDICREHGFPKLLLEINSLNSLVKKDWIAYGIGDDGKLTTQSHLNEVESIPQVVELPIDKQSVTDTAIEFYKQVLNRKLSLEYPDLS